MKSRPTIRDVAERASVSTATVSFVLNNNPNEVISDKVKAVPFGCATGCLRSINT